MVHGLKGHPYKTWRYDEGIKDTKKRKIDSPQKTSNLITSKRLVFRQSIKALMKGSSSQSNQETELAETSNNESSTAEVINSSVFWPADLLPTICEKARILTFGYDTKITKYTSGPTNTNSIYSHGKDFLFSLGREHILDRPLIFIAHSLGGILVKEVSNINIILIFNLLTTLSDADAILHL